jgi:hypothetical protein
MLYSNLRKSGALCGVAVVVAVAALGLPAFSQSITLPPMPGNLTVPDGNTAFMMAQAVGTQNYACLPSGPGFAWTFQGPQATLFITYKWMNGEIRQQVATHFLSPNPMEATMPARPTWQHSLDTSAVWAKKKDESSNPNYVAPGAIPWLLLEVVGTQRGPADGSILAQTTFIQRVNTTGGIMPADGCSAAGQLRFVPYTADYIFYRAGKAK